MIQYGGKLDISICGQPVGYGTAFELETSTKELRGWGAGSYPLRVADRAKLDIKVAEMNIPDLVVMLDGVPVGTVSSALLTNMGAETRPRLDLRSVYLKEGVKLTPADRGKLVAQLPLLSGDATKASQPTSHKARYPTPPFKLDEDPVAWALSSLSDARDHSADALSHHLAKYALNSTFGKLRADSAIANTLPGSSSSCNMNTDASQLTEGDNMNRPDVSVFQTNFTTAVVRLQAGAAVFKTRNFGLVVGSPVVVAATPSRSPAAGVANLYLVGYVEEVHPTPQLRAGESYDWIAHELDLSGYNAEKAAEATFHATMEKVEATRRREEAIRQFSASLESNPEASALFDNAVTTLTGGNLHFRAMPVTSAFDTPTTRGDSNGAQES